MKFKIFKKIFPAILTVILISLISFPYPTKTYATVPVNDSQANTTLSNILTTDNNIYRNAIDILGNVTSLVEKEFNLDPTLWSWIKDLLNELAKSVTNWLKTGSFNTDPQFITNVKKWFSSALTDSTGISLDNLQNAITSGAICQPYGTPIYNSLASQRTQALQSAQSKGGNFSFDICTLLAGVNSQAGMANYMQDFNAGGAWDTWNNMWSEPQNNIYGATVIAMNEMENAATREKERKALEAQMNLGYLGEKECTKYSPSGYCEDETISSPGRWVGDITEWQTTSEIRTQELADECDETMGGLAGSISNWITGGLSGALQGIVSGLTSVVIGNLIGTACGDGYANQSSGGGGGGGGLIGGLIGGGGGGGGGLIGGGGGGLDFSQPWGGL